MTESQEKTTPQENPILQKKTSLKELVGCDRAIKIEVARKDYREFFEYAKAEGCLWSTGEVIKPKTAKQNIPLELENSCEVFKVERDLYVDGLYYISVLHTYWGYYQMHGAKKYYFKDILEGMTCEEIDERARVEEAAKRAKTKRKDEELELTCQAKELALKKRCRENHRINKLQLKNRSAAARLPKVFYVKYENDEELLRLFLLFAHCGYENLYSLEPDHFPQNPRVITLDNQNMTFCPSSIVDCSCALLIRKKLYNTQEMEKLMADVFGESDAVVAI